MTHEALTANALDMVLALQMSAVDEILTFTPMFPQCTVGRAERSRLAGIAGRAGLA